MATRGEEKWKKYFSKGNVRTTTSGFEVPAYRDARTKEVETYLRPNTPIEVISSDRWLGRYQVHRYNERVDRPLWLNDVNVVKPKIAGSRTDHLNLTGTHFVDLGKEVVLNWNNQSVDCICFEYKAHLKDSVRDAIVDIKGLGIDAVEAIEDCFKPHPQEIRWGDTPVNIKDELGKHLGEVLYGYHLLDSGQADKVYFPKDEHFAGYDSFVLSNKEIVSVSNKYGSGNTPSIWPLLAQTAGAPGDTALNRLKGHLVSYKGKSKLAIIQFALDEIFGDKRLSPDFGQFIVEAVNENKHHDTLDYVKKKIEQYGVTADKGYKEKFDEHWPKSLMSFCSKTVCNTLNACELSKLDMMDTLIQQNGRLVRLNNIDWRQGKMNFEEDDYASLSLTFRNKAMTHDFTGSGGTVCYYLS